MEWDYEVILTEIASELNAEKLEFQQHQIKAAAA